MIPKVNASMNFTVLYFDIWGPLKIEYTFFWLQLYAGDNPESCFREVPSVMKSLDVWWSL